DDLQPAQATGHSRDPRPHVPDLRDAVSVASEEDQLPAGAVRRVTNLQQLEPFLDQRRFDLLPITEAQRGHRLEHDIVTPERGHRPERDEVARHLGDVLPRFHDTDTWHIHDRAGEFWRPLLPGATGGIARL